MIVNYTAKKIQVKIVYYGPEGSGKTTSLKSLFKIIGKTDNLCAIETMAGRTLFFDFGTLTFKGADWNIEVVVYSATGQDFYASTRPQTLQGADAIIFVADYQESKYDDNMFSWRELEYFYGDSMKSLTIVMCFNKRDLATFCKGQFINEIDTDQIKNFSTFETIATEDICTYEAFEAAMQCVFPSVTIKK